MTSKQIQETRKLLEWAEKEIRLLDELCRSQVPGYEPLESNDIEKLHAMLRLSRAAK